MNTAPGNMHDWRFESSSYKSLLIETAAIDIMHDIESLSGHGHDEQMLLDKALSAIAESETLSATFRLYLFELWKQRKATSAKRDRAAQFIANMIAPIIRDIIKSDVRKEFDN